MCHGRVYLFKKSMDQGHCPIGILEMVPHCSCQKFIPYKHCFINNMSSIFVIYVLLKTAHDVVRVAEEEVLRKIDRAKETFISTKGGQ